MDEERHRNTESRRFENDIHDASSDLSAVGDPAQPDSDGVGGREVAAVGRRLGISFRSEDGACTGVGRLGLGKRGVGWQAF